ncbi:undecaprenyl-diphosphatase, partial [Candidatus Saccharibacteria bacterium]|nr:undecaprenyl-diphosphatase [Candidatus Saccharibacteria bacterium]
MPLYQAVVLGIVQGLTEIFPVSSSGHLIIFPELLGWAPHTLAFDAALHLGTAFALLWWFDKAWIALFKTRSWRMMAFILLASVPAGLVGLFFGDFIEANLRSPRLIAYSLITVAFLMFLVEWFY